MVAVKNFKRFAKTCVNTKHPMLLVFAGEYSRYELDLIPTEIEFDEEDKEVYIEAKNIETGVDMSFTYSYEQLEETVEEEIFNFRFKNHDYLELSLEY